MLEALERFNKIPWIATLAIGITIFYVSSLEFGTSSTGTGNLSIIYHVGIFFIFSLLFFISAIKRGKIKLIPLVIIISIIYGILDELHQFFVPGRYSSFFDIILDTIGIAIASAFYLILVLSKRRNS